MSHLGVLIGYTLFILLFALMSDCGISGFMSRLLISRLLDASPASRI